MLLHAVSGIGGAGAPKAACGGQSFGGSRQRCGAGARGCRVRGFGAEMRLCGGWFGGASGSIRRWGCLRAHPLVLTRLVVESAEGPRGSRGGASRWGCSGPGCSG